MINENEWIVVGLITSPHGINGKVKVFGIIKCFKSIKKIIIKKMLNIANSKEVIDIPNK